MAHTKSGGVVKNIGDSISKRLGVKLFDGQKVAAGQIIVRQRGSKFFPGAGVKKGADDTLYAATTGVVKFSTKTRRRFNGDKNKAKVIEVRPTA